MRHAHLHICAITGVPLAFQQRMTLKPVTSITNLCLTPLVNTFWDVF
jgi:hypothetical protein